MTKPGNTTQPAAPRPSARVAKFRNDKLYPKIKRAVAARLAVGKIVAPVDVLVGMDLLKREDLEAWRFGRVDYLERVLKGNLSRLSRLLRILRFHAQELTLAPSTTVYMRWGKGPKQRLRFTKSRDPNIELAYATHFIGKGKEPFHPPASSDTPPGAG